MNQKPIHDIKPFLATIAAKKTLETAMVSRWFDALLKGQLTESQIKQLLLALNTITLTPEILLGAYKSLRKKIIPIQAPLGAIDVCGTGGDGHHTLNISTAAAFVVAACGVPVAKHGNRAVSSKSGSADVLEALGAKIDLLPKQVELCLRETGIGFMFAPHHNPAMGLVAKIRKELGVKTIFNVLGPLLNPANCAYQLIGVYDWNLLNPVGLMLESAGRKRAWVVHCDGVDELMTTGMNTCCQVDGGNVGIFNVSPEGLGLQAVEIADIKGGDAAFNAAAIQDLVAGKPSPYRDVVVLNAAAALVIARKAQSIKPKHAFLPDPEEDLKIGVALAIEALDRGKVRKTLENFVAFTREI